MIRTVRIRGFKRFGEVEFRLPGHVVLAGPNNTGKTTVLQAIASWSLALRRWRELNDFRLRRGLAYGKAPIARQAFSAVPLRSFDLLWTDRRYRGQIEIELRHDAGWSVTMEFTADSTEQIYVRPKAKTIAIPTAGTVSRPTTKELAKEKSQPAAGTRSSGCVRASDDRVGDERTSVAARGGRTASRPRPPR